ncbi:MAG: hypothetical protein H0X66_07905 [Verrucomicrobia bacterium]|nr:hypothetical protein [Verrucomicrobiota bacterium]
MPIEKLIFIYLLAILGAVGGVATLTEMRKRRFRADPNKDRVFRCEKCSFVYTDDADVDRSRCSQCGELNNAIEF